MFKHAKGEDNSAVYQPASQVATETLSENGIAEFFDEDDDEDNHDAQDIHTTVDKILGSNSQKDMKIDNKDNKHAKIEYIHEFDEGMVDESGDGEVQEKEWWAAG